MEPRRMKAAIEAVSNKEMGSYMAPRVFIICLPPHSSHKMHKMDKAFMRPRKHSIAKKLKMAAFNPRQIRHPLTNWRTIRKIQASCNRSDSGYWLPGDRPFPLRPEPLHTTRFPSSAREHRCCSCEPFCFTEDQRSAISKFC
jgi:hypothetical protein